MPRRGVSTLISWCRKRPLFDDSHGLLARMTSSEYPFISVIVVAEADVSTHEACIATVLSDTDYPNYELLVAR